MLCAAGVAVLLLHVLLTAFVPPELLLLADHDHVTLGYITPEAWQEHLKFHLQQARDLLAGVKTTAGTTTQGSTRILSMPGCDMSVQNTSPLALAVLPVSHTQMHLVRVAGTAIEYPQTLDRSPQRRVPHLPPRNSV
jgi:hypothetical protein